MKYSLAHSLTEKILLPLLLFFCDLCVLSLFTFPCLQLLTTYTVVQLLYVSSFTTIFCALLLSVLFSLIATGVCLPYGIFLLGILAATKGLSLYYPTNQRLIAGSMTALLSLLHLIFFPYKSLFLLYTILAFTGNIIAMYFSLKWFSAVKRGNRA